MGDQTLLDFDIIYEARRRSLLVPFDEERLKGASYDLRVGDYVIAVTSKGYERVSLKELKHIEIQAGQTVVLYSLERLSLPADMRGRISLRSFWAIKGLYFNGGLVDPGYTGLLFFNVTNLGSSTIRIDYATGLVTLELTRLDQPTQRIYNDGEPILDVPEEKLPPLLLHPDEDLASLRAQVAQLAERLTVLEKKL